MIRCFLLRNSGYWSARAKARWRKVMTENLRELVEAIRPMCGATFERGLEPVQ